MSIPFTLVIIVAVMLFSALPSIYAQVPPSEQDLETYEVTYEDNTIEVKAALSDDGRIDGIEVYPEIGSILLTLDMGSQGGDEELTIVLPRVLIDSKAGGADDVFLIVVDGFDVEYEETLTTETSRTLKFPLAEDSFEVEIFGSQVIPEFPFGLAVIAVPATIGLVLILHRIASSGNLMSRYHDL